MSFNLEALMSFQFILMGKSLEAVPLRRARAGTFRSADLLVALGGPVGVHYSPWNLSPQSLCPGQPLFMHVGCVFSWVTGWRSQVPWEEPVSQGYSPRAAGTFPNRNREVFPLQILGKSSQMCPHCNCIQVLHKRLWVCDLTALHAAKGVWLSLLSVSCP